MSENAEETLPALFEDGALKLDEEGDYSEKINRLLDLYQTRVFRWLVLFLPVIGLIADKELGQKILERDKARAERFNRDVDERLKRVERSLKDLLSDDGFLVCFRESASEAGRTVSETKREMLAALVAGAAADDAPSDAFEDVEALRKVLVGMSSREIELVRAVLWAESEIRGSNVNKQYSRGHLELAIHRKVLQGTRWVSDDIQAVGNRLQGLGLVIYLENPRQVQNAHPAEHGLRVTTTLRRLEALLGKGGVVLARSPHESD